MLRHVGMGDAPADAAQTQSFYTDPEGYTAFGAPLDAPISDSSSDTYTANVPDAASGIATVAAAALPNIPWWVWLGGAALAFLALHHEFKN